MTAAVDLFVANDLTANFLFPQPRRIPFPGNGGRVRAWPPMPRADTSPAWASPAATSTAMAGSTWPSPTSTANRPRSTRTSGRDSSSTAPPRSAWQPRAAICSGFGAAFFDANNDGRLDLATANGHVNDLRPHVPYAMPAQLLLGESSGGRLMDVSPRRHPWQVPRLGRGLAVGDLDNDGRLDLVIVAEGEPLAYFHNQGPAGHFVTFELEGASPASNRDAVRCAADAHRRRPPPGRPTVRWRQLPLGQRRRPHFGLGAATRIEALEVRWPSGRVDHYTNLEADAAYHLREGQIEVPRLRGWKRQAAGQ